MKSFIKIALLVFYVFFNAGLSYSMHFCGGDYQRINVYSEYDSCCDLPETMPGCCGDVSNLDLPNTDQQVSTILDFQLISFDIELPNFNIELPVELSSITEKTASFNFPPPIFQNTPIYIFCQVFLI